MRAAKVADICRDKDKGKGKDGGRAEAKAEAEASLRRCRSSRRDFIWSVVAALHCAPAFGRAEALCERGSIYVDKVKGNGKVKGEGKGKGGGKSGGKSGGEASLRR
jgi:hypothetical protein